MPRKPRHHEPPKAVEVNEKLEHFVLREYCEYMKRIGENGKDTSQRILAELASIREILKMIERKL
jgi:hypothetical protein